MPRPLSRARVLKPQPTQGLGLARPIFLLNLNRTGEVPGQHRDSPWFLPSSVRQAAVYLRETGLPSGTVIWFLWLIMGTHLPLCHFLQIKQFLRKGTHSLKYIVWFGGDIWFLGFL